MRSLFQTKNICAALAVALLATGCELNKLPESNIAPAQDAGTDVVPADPIDPIDDPGPPTDAGREPDPIEEPPPPPPPPPPPGTGLTPPTLGTLQVVGTPTVGQPSVFRVDVADAEGVVSCQLAINSGAGSMQLYTAAGVASDSVTDGYAETTYMPSRVETIAFRVVCSDEDGASASSGAVSVTVAPAPPPPPGPDLVAPSVLLHAPGNGQTFDVRDAVAYAATAYDAKGVVSCEVLINGVPALGATLAEGTVTGSAVIGTPGSATIAVRCVDAAGNLGSSESRTVDLVRVPGLGITSVNDGNVVIGTTVTFAAPVEARTTMSSCALLLDAIPVGGTPTINVGSVRQSVMMTAADTYQAQFRCTDTQGIEHVSNGVSVTVTPDVTAPVVGAVTWSPADAYPTAGAAYTFSAPASDNYLLGSCEAWFTDSGIFTTAPAAAPVSGGVASLAVAAYNGFDTVTISCRDAAGNIASSSAAIPDAPIVTP